MSRVVGRFLAPIALENTVPAGGSIRRSENQYELKISRRPMLLVVKTFRPRDNVREPRTPPFGGEFRSNTLSHVPKPVLLHTDGGF